MPKVELKYKDSTMTLLTKEQVYDESSKIDIIKQYGNKCTPTDFALLLGYVIEQDAFVDDSKSLESRCAIWHTSSSLYAQRYQNYYSILGGESKDTYYLTPGYKSTNSVGIRPVIPITVTKITGGKIKRCFTTEVFEFPQYVPSNEICQILEMKYRAGTLKKTGKYYVTNASDYNHSFEPFKNDEYYYNGKKYVRVQAKVDNVLSNGQSVKKGDYVWIEVSPVEWYYDIKAKLLLSKHVLSSGVRFGKDGIFNRPLEETDVYKYMNDCLFKELTNPSVVEETLTDKIEQLLMEIKSYQTYYEGLIDVEDVVGNLIGKYNANIMSQLYGNNELSLGSNDPSSLANNLMCDLNVVLGEVKECERKLKPYYDMINILEACYEDNLKPELDDICNDIYNIRTVCINFITNSNIKSKLKSELNKMLDNKIYSLKNIISKYKKTKVIEPKTLEELEKEFRSLLAPYLIKINNYIIKQDVVSEIMNNTRLMIENTFIESKNDRVKSMLNILNNSIIEIKRIGNQEDLNKLKEITKEIDLISFNVGVEKILEQFGQIIRKVYRLELDIEEREKKREKIINHIVGVNVRAIFDEDRFIKEHIL